MKEKEVWRYENVDKSNIFVVYELVEGLLINYPEGTLQIEGTKKLFEFFSHYEEKINKKILLIIDNSKVKAIDVKASKYVADFVSKATPIRRAATFGSNFFIRNFMNLFIAIMTKMDLQHCSFKTKEEAIEWVQKNDKGCFL